MKNLKNYSLLFILSCFLLFSCKDKKGDTNYLISNSDKKGTSEQELSKEVEKFQNIIFRPELLTRQKEIKAQLFDEIITVYIDEKFPSMEKNVIYAKIKDAKGENYVIIASSGKTYAANILKDGILYQVRWIGDEVYQLRKIDQSKFPQECKSSVPKGINQKGLEQDACANTDPADFIDVMVAYTDDARASAGSKDAIEAEIYLATYEANLAYFNSNVTQRIRLVHLVEVSYAETGDVELDRNRLQNSSDGFLDNLHTLRNTHFADIVMLMTQSCDYCGMAYIMDPVSSGFENFGFGVVKRSCATGYYSFVHEMAHIMGCRHLCATDNTLTPYDYGHAFEYCTGGTAFRTVMAYSGSCNNSTTPRLPYFSNPGVSYLGIAMGTNTGTCQADNHRVLNNTALTVANFRCHSSNINNVWMKDTWDDSGLEPDPATAGAAMWQSPYIWIRTSQDASFAHQHEHQNPEMGQANWIYVKMHNGGPVANGNLKLYYANASISLAWPAGFTLLATIPVSIGAATSKIVEQQWASLPGAGHYCMLARWESATDPMTFAETADINYNTRQNNNIVWRNLNIVDLVADSEGDALVNFIASKGSSIQINFDTKYSNKSFVPSGRIIVSFDEKTAEKFPDGIKGNGFRMVEKNMYEITSEKGATFDGLYTDKEYKGTIKLRFSKGKNTPASKYWISIKQVIGSKVIGGVNYQINTDYN